jgi:hypothetical protein
LRWLFAEFGMADDPRLRTLVPAMLRSLSEGREAAAAPTEVVS